MRIGFAICDPGLSFGAIVGLGAKERAAELGVELSVVSVFTPAEQAAVIERFVRDGVAALIVSTVVAARRYADRKMSGQGRR